MGGAGVTLHLLGAIAMLLERASRVEANAVTELTLFEDRLELHGHVTLAQRDRIALERCGWTLTHDGAERWTLTATRSPDDADDQLVGAFERASR